MTDLPYLRCKGASVIRRDTYHDYLTEQELAEARWPIRAKFIMDTVMYILRWRSGANNVANAVLHTWRDDYRRAYCYSVSFDSSAWTGRHG